MFLYDLPFGEGQSLAAPSAWLRAIVGGWQVGGSLIWQTGFPIALTGASDGAALTRPDRVDGVPIVLPENLWGWYDGRTPVTLPSGRVISPPARIPSRILPAKAGSHT